MKESKLADLIHRLEQRQPVSRRTFLGLLGVGASLAAGGPILEACGGAATTSAGPTNELFRMGAIQPQTGALVASFKPQFVGFNLAVKEINNAGGVLGRKILVDTYDDQGAPAQEPTVAQRILGDKVAFVYGPIGSSQALASLEITQRRPNKIIQFPGGADESLSDPVKNPGSFSLVQTTFQGLAVLVDGIAKLPSPRVGIVYENTAYGQAGGPQAAKMLGDKGIKPITTEVYEQNSPNLAPVVTRLKDSGADTLVYYGSIAPDAIKFATAMVQTGYTPNIFGANSFLATIAKTIPKDIDIPNAFLNKIRLPVYKTFLWEKGKSFPPRWQNYFKAVLSDPDTGPNVYTVANGSSYDAVYMMKTAIQAAGTFDYDKVHKALETVKYEGILGTMKFSSKSHLGISDDDIGLGLVNDLTAPESLGFLPMKA